MKKILLPVVAALGFTAGCYTHGDVGMSYSSGGGYYAASGPDLYYYSPGVSVVAYSDDPVFYSDNYYWRYYDGVWYQSPYYNTGWSVSYNVPYSYARFRPGQGWTRVRAGNTGYAQGGVQVRDHRGGNGYYNNGGYARPAPQPTVRDHRSYQPAPAPRAAPAPAPVVRDHRSGYVPPAAPSRAPAPPTVRDHRR